MDKHAQSSNGENRDRYTCTTGENRDGHTYTTPTQRKQRRTHMHNPTQREQMDKRAQPLHGEKRDGDTHAQTSHEEKTGPTYIPLKNLHAHAQ